MLAYFLEFRYRYCLLSWSRVRAGIGSELLRNDFFVSFAKKKKKKKGPSTGVRVVRVPLLRFLGLPNQLPQTICITFVQRRPNVFDVSPSLYKCYTNVLCLLGEPYV